VGFRQAANASDLPRCRREALASKECAKIVGVPRRALVLLPLLLVSCSTLLGERTPPASSVSLEGMGAGREESMSLVAGDYELQWQARVPDGSAECSFDAVLQPDPAGGTNGAASWPLGAYLVTADRSRSGQQAPDGRMISASPAGGSVNASDLPAGPYSLRVSSDCAWTVTVSPAISS
jgi:hypothetical protein